jgi:DNA replication protein DnaC
MNRAAKTRLELEGELRGCGRSLMLSNRTMEAYAAKATPKQIDFLLEMMHFELDYREENKRTRLLKKAAFPAPKSFDGYEWDGIEIPLQLTREELLGCEFVKCSKNLVLFGPVGTGKTHMMIALGSIACNLGMIVRFFTVSDLVMRLSAAKAEGTLDKLLRDIFRADMLCLDELGYVPIDRDGARLLFQVISHSYETRSLVISTNVEFSKWGSVFTDDQMAAAMIDRIAHHGHLLVFDRESYRIRHALMRQIA